MPLLDEGRRRAIARVTRSVAVRALAALSVFIVVYVAYAHVASVVTMTEYKLATYSEKLDSTAALARFEVGERGGLSHALEGGALRVRGTAASSGVAEVRFTGPVQRLDDAVSTRLRYRVRSSGAYDVFVGFEKDDADGANEKRRIVVSMRNGAAMPFAIEGDVKTNGPRKWGQQLTPVVADADAGSDADAGADADVGEEWHELSLKLAAYMRGAFASQDGKPVAAEIAQWWMGTRVRMIFGVIAREPGAVVDVDLAEAAYTQEERPQPLPPFTDRFRGRVLDSRLWVVALPDGRKSEVTYATDPTAGLRFHGRSLGEPGFQAAITLISTPTPLGSFTLKGRFDIQKLEGGAIILGVIGAGYSPARFVDLGVRKTKAGELEPIVVGHWKGDNQLSIHEIPGNWPEPEGTLAMTYDQDTGGFVVHINGKPRFQQKLDILPDETIAIRVGVTFDSPTAEIDAIVREVSFDRPVLSPVR